MPGASPDRVDDLLCRLADGLLAENEERELEQILLADPEARERYRQYRERGCTLESHNL